MNGFSSGLSLPYKAVEIEPKPTCTTFCRVPHPECSLIGRVKRACVGKGEEGEGALEDEFGIRVTVRSCCESYM